MSAVDFRINKDISVELSKDGPKVRIVFNERGCKTGVQMSALEAIQAGGDLCKQGSSEAIPFIKFEDQEAVLCGNRLMSFAADGR